MGSLQARLRTGVISLAVAALAVALLAPGASAWSGTIGPVAVSRVSINGGGSVADVQPGATVTVSFDYAIHDAGCPACHEQIQVGWSTEGEPQQCAYDGLPGAPGVEGRGTIQLTAPLTAGPAYLAFDAASDTSCDASRWFNGDPNNRPEQQLVGRINVGTRAVILGGTRITRVSIDGGGLDARVAAGAKVTVSFRYQDSFPGMQIGWAQRGAPSRCVAIADQTSGKRTLTLRAPRTKGSWFIALDTSDTAVCPLHWTSTPLTPVQQFIAHITTK